MLRVVLVVQVEGNLEESECFRANNILIATPLLSPMELVYKFSGPELARKKMKSSGILLARQQYIFATPVIHGMVTLGFRVQGLGFGVPGSW